MPQPDPQPAALFRQPSPEEAELFQSRARLAVLRAALAEREASLADLRAQLNSFEGRYIRQVGVLYIQLDEWEERIAELNSPRRLPEAADQPAPPSTEAGTESAPRQVLLDLKALFREVAKRIHPDFARDHHDERHRTHLMAQANDAFRRDDAAILQRMLNGYDPSTDTGDNPNTPAERTRVRAQILAQIDQATQDIDIIDAELEALAQSEMAQLKQRTTHAALHGRDLLAELAARVKGSIGIAMRRYELDLGRIRRKQPAFDPTPLLSAETGPSRPTASRATIKSDEC